MAKKDITIILTESDSWLLAQLFKRITFEGVADCAAGKDETYQMINVIENARNQFAAQGVAPR